MQESKKKELCDQLDSIDTSLLFLLLIIAAVLLSYWSVRIQRGQLCRIISGEVTATDPQPSVFPIRHFSSALTVGSLGFFLCMALGMFTRAEAGDDCVAKRSARTNLWASILVLAATILRFNDLNFVEASRRSALLEADTLPE